MKIEKSYFIKTINYVLVWLAVGSEIPEGAIIVEERPVIIPAEGMLLRNKKNGRVLGAHWLREGSAEDYEEIPEPKEEAE